MVKVNSCTTADGLLLLHFTLYKLKILHFEWFQIISNYMFSLEFSTVTSLMQIWQKLHAGRASANNKNNGTL